MRGVLSVKITWYKATFESEPDVGSVLQFH